MIERAVRPKMGAYVILELSVAHEIYYCDYIVCRLLEWYLLGSILIDAAATSFVDAQILFSDI